MTAESIHSQDDGNCWQNSFPCSRWTEGPSFLLAVHWKHPQPLEATELLGAACSSQRLPTVPHHVAFKHNLLCSQQRFPKQSARKMESHMTFYRNDIHLFALSYSREENHTIMMNFLKPGLAWCLPVAQAQTGLATEQLKATLGSLGSSFPNTATLASQARTWRRSSPYMGSAHPGALWIPRAPPQPLPALLWVLVWL